MKSQPDNRPLASVESDLFGTLFGFHTKTMTLLRESSLDDEKKSVVADRIKKLLDEATTDMKESQPINLAERLEAAYEEVKRLVDELSGANADGDNDQKAKSKTRRLKGRKNIP